MSEYLLCLILFSIGLYCVVRKRNLIKIIIGIGIMEYAANLFFVLAGYRKTGRSPIFSADQQVLNMVDPLPQAVVLTAIVIGLALTLLLVAVSIKIYEKYGTFDITKINKLKG
ncbi:MAG: sodium:proton antiporter [Candidatus Omnitrophica bacterium]|nr:sodium:proton antiporter [Candidatus Omnitrophota bacterium]MDD5436440.1 sodium:proton antiporter [Candidatus Omnitrophota bacterium]